MVVAVAEAASISFSKSSSPKSRRLAWSGAGGFAAADGGAKAGEEVGVVVVPRRLSQKEAGTVGVAAGVEATEGTAASGVVGAAEAVCGFSGDATGEAEPTDATAGATAGEACFPTGGEPAGEARFGRAAAAAD